MMNNSTRARARDEAARQWADRHGERFPSPEWRREDVEAGFAAGAAWGAEMALAPGSDAEVNEIVASLIRDAQSAGGDEAAEHAAKRIAAYFAGVHGAEQDLWAIERATGQRQLDEAAVLIRENAALLRGYEAHHRDLAAEARDAGDFSNGERRDEKAERNAQMAARLEAWLAGETDPDLATGCADDLAPPLGGKTLDQHRADLWACRLSGQIEDDQWEGHLRDDPGLAEYERPVAVPAGGCAPHIIAVPANRAPRADLVAAIAGASLIEEGVGWVKVHGLSDARPLFNLLASAKAQPQAQSGLAVRPIPQRQAALLAEVIGRRVTKRSGDYDFDGEIRAVIPKRSGAIRYVVEDERGLLLIMSAGQCGLEGDAAARWRTEGVADLAAFRITTPDPRFDPAAPATINGFLYHPAKET